MVYARIKSFLPKLLLLFSLGCVPHPHGPFYAA
jgi:hypothetical protein